LPPLDYLFLGNAIESVDERGDLPLPPFVGGCLEDEASDSLYIGPHESDPCLTGYIAAHAAALYLETERLRLRDEDKGVPRGAHFARTRRAFGQVERADLAPGGKLRLTSWMRTRGRIENAALVVGAGATFEIWNPELARRSDDPQLRELASYRLQQGDESDFEEGEEE
jgi:DNA-binding transcriptional regulator/RsmH inhibitor MraZ